MSTEREILNQTAGMVATELGDGWTVVAREPDWAGPPSISGPDGEHLIIRKDGYGDDVDRVVIFGYLGHLMDNGQQWPYGLDTNHEIKVKRDRGPAVIAREIRRRLLPNYQAAIAVLRDHVDTDRAALDARRALAATLTGEPVRDGDDAQSVRLGRVSDEWYGDARLRYAADGVSELKLHGLTVAQTVAILDVLRREG